MSYTYGQPVYILSEGSRRTRGRDAQWMFIRAGKAVSEAVRTTLGPKGMDKMLVDPSGTVVITNDGVTILEEMDIEHPAAQMIVEVASTQEEETGDGTTTAVIIAGELLAKAEDLLDDDIHPTVIANGYRFAAAEARSVLEALAMQVDADDEDTLRKIAMTAMTGKGAEASKDLLAGLVVSAVQAVADEDGIDLDDVVIETAVGGSVADSRLVEGVVVDKERAHESMPTRVEDASVLLLETPIEVRGLEADAELSITTPAQLEEFIAREEGELRGVVDSIVESGANVVFCQQGIDDLARHFLARKGVLALRRVKKSDMHALARATGAKSVGDLSDIESAHLGHAGLVEERRIGDDTLLFVEECENPKSVSILLRGGTDHVVTEVERALTDALGVVRVTMQEGTVVPGGSAPEIELARAIRDFADGVSGREQLAVEAFADALDVVPRTLAENAGLDPIDTLIELRARHDRGETSAGLDAYTGEVGDMEDLHVVEPLRVKLQAIESATEAVELLLRIDDVVAARLNNSGGDDFGEMDF
ncbi:thermosome subunit alpha [Halomarina litorea]|uniref:thermosome subunit alpha n=1 Tax=Halomarina litorea TaxID=2961595 RepID=UPI0020C4ECEE|nr:thermosome subunit alpha [Halomarina sp. BCD28]